MKRIYLSTIIALFLLVPGMALAAETYLAPRNTEVPFPYLQEGTRSWPILRQALPNGTQVHFTAKVDDKVLAEGPVLQLSGITVSMGEDQKLTIVAEAQDTPLAFSLDVDVTFSDGTTESQALLVIPAPPVRPLSYLADFGDDLIRIFNISSTGKWRALTKDAFDQYFRRCQLHGVDRMILWLSPMPFIVAPENYAPEDWARYEAQAKALNGSEDFRNLVDEQHKGAEEGHWGVLLAWDWVRQLNGYRLMREFGPMLSKSAVEHGVKLSVSFHPFETALTK
ncbi:MAG: hypothetical protein L3K26_08710, partial [Candidatus Hydrogenedentes bacterium]|nr:hypothetical protein [Candidatus Hydrogenedentota bacterium]